jgi:hypothetical protein
MTTESVIRKPVASGGRIPQAGILVFLLFIISVSSVSEIWAQSLSLTDEQMLLDAYNQQRGKAPATTPETYSAPQFDLSPDTSSVTNMEQFPSFDPTVAADGDSEFFRDMLPKPGGTSTPITGLITTSVLLAQL